MPWCTTGPFDDQVPRLAAYREVTRVGALCLAAEVFDWRRFPRARPFMSFTGLVPGRTRRVSPNGGARSPGPPMPTCAASSVKRPGPTSTARTWASASESAKQVCRPRPWPARGRRRSACLGASANSLPTRTCARSWLPPSPASSPGSSGPRWWPRSDTVFFASLSARSAPRLSEPSATRRSTAAADPILAGVTPTIVACDDVTGALTQRQPPANGFTAISIRVHHRGGSPIHCAPARRRWLARPPPPSARGDEEQPPPRRQYRSSSPFGLRALRIDVGAPPTAQERSGAAPLVRRGPKDSSQDLRGGVDTPFHIIAAGMVGQFNGDRPRAATVRVLSAGYFPSCGVSPSTCIS